MQNYDIIIIGSGPAGKTAAIQAAKLGKNVALVDGMPQVGGVCVHTGTIPSKTLRETVLNLTGWRERGFYGRSYRVKSDISASDLMQRLNITLQNEVDILEDKWTVVTKDHSLSAQWEHTILVTGSGYEVLTLGAAERS